MAAACAGRAANSAAEPPPDVADNGDGGRIALNVPGPAGPPFAILIDAMARHVGDGAAGFIRTVFSLHDEAELEGLLRDAGFRDPSATAR